MWETLILAKLANVRWSRVLPFAIIIGVAIGVAFYIAILKIQVTNAQAERDAAIARQMIANVQYDRCVINRKNIQAALDDQNAMIDLWRERALERAEAQARADRLAKEMARATAELARIRADHRELVEKARDLDVCATYRLALEAISE
jgi:hypothetical protein